MLKKLHLWLTKDLKQLFIETAQILKRSERGTLKLFWRVNNYNKWFWFSARSRSASFCATLKRSAKLRLRRAALTSSHFVYAGREVQPSPDQEVPRFARSRNSAMLKIYSLETQLKILSGFLINNNAAKANKWIDQWATTKPQITQATAITTDKTPKISLAVRRYKIMLPKVVTNINRGKMGREIIITIAS